MVHQSDEIREIERFYGNRKAARSGVHLINHIYEGIAILESLHATESAKKAFCIHPIVQNNEVIDVSWSEAYILACEYRDMANAFLCRPENDWITTIDDMPGILKRMSNDCKAMLIADKLQNKKDFSLYHKNSHPRATQLENYFCLWLLFLTGRVPGNEPLEK